MTKKMPAKKRNDPKFKPFIGRIFTLRQNKTIPSYKNNQDLVDARPGDFGDVVLVLDENNTRAKVPLNDGTFTWIPKYYLHKEIKSGIFEDVDGISGCLQDLLSLAEEMQTNKAAGMYKTYAKEIERVANLLRHYIDDINPSNKSNN